MQRLFTLCGLIYVLIYAAEGVVRYGLYNVGLDSAILIRDLLLIVPLGLLFVVQLFRGRVHPAFLVFAGLIALHGAIAAFNMHSYLPAVYGAKLLVNVLFGFLAARELMQPSRRMLTIFALIWVATLTGVILDKFVFTFPWTGLETHIGGIQVDVSRGWDIEDSFDKRSAGFTRSSISAAMLLPVLALILAPKVNNWFMRALMLLLTLGGVLLTTQKGSMLALAVVAGAMCAPKFSRHVLLCASAIGFALLTVALPPLTAGLLMPESAGVFSFASLGMRITGTWPQAWEWITQNDVFPFGVGLGGIGGAQRFYAADFFNPSDNLFLYLYANFGVLALFYLGWVTALGPRLPREMQERATAALAVLAFLLGYGAALSMLEDQIAALFAGASIGMLWQCLQLASAGGWGDAYVGTRLRRLLPSTGPGYATMRGQAVGPR